MTFNLTELQRIRNAIAVDLDRREASPHRDQFEREIDLNREILRKVDQLYLRQ